MLYLCARFGNGVKIGVHGDEDFILLAWKQVFCSYGNKHSSRTETSILLAWKQVFHSHGNEYSIRGKTDVPQVNCNVRPQ